MIKTARCHVATHEAIRRLLRKKLTCKTVEEILILLPECNHHTHQHVLYWFDNEVRCRYCYHHNLEEDIIEAYKKIGKSIDQKERFAL